MRKSSRDKKFEECTFKPEKVSNLDYSFTKEYKDTAMRLYKDAEN